MDILQVRTKSRASKTQLTYPAPRPFPRPTLVPVEEAHYRLLYSSICLRGVSIHAAISSFEADPSAKGAPE